LFYFIFYQIRAFLGFFSKFSIIYLNLLDFDFFCTPEKILDKAKASFTHLDNKILALRDSFNKFKDKFGFFKGFKKYKMQFLTKYSFFPKNFIKSTGELKPNYLEFISSFFFGMPKPLLKSNAFKHSLYSFFSIFFDPSVFRKSVF
jgi:hypothetical protein